MSIENKAMSQNHYVILLQKILDTTSTMIFWKDAERRFLGVNKAFLDYYGFPSEDVLIGKTDEDMGWHSDPDPFKNDEVQVLQKGISTYRIHGKCIAQGKERDILASKSPFYDNGKIVGLVGAFEDVTDEYQWQKENERFSRILDNVPSGIVIYRKDGAHVLCVYANQFFLDMLGLVDPYMVIGRNVEVIAKMIHPDDVEEMLLFEREMKQGKDIQDGTFRFRRVGTTEYHWYHQVCRRIPQLHQDSLYYVSYTDIDAEKNAGIMLQKSQAIYEMAIHNARMLLFEYDISSRTVTMEPIPHNLLLADEYGLPHVMKNMPESRLFNVRLADQAAFSKLYETVHSGQSASCEVWAVGAGKYKDHCERISYTVIRDDFGTPIQAFGVAINITEVKIKEEKYKDFTNYAKGAIKDALAYFRLNLTTNWCDNGFSEEESLLKFQRDGTAEGFFEEVQKHIAHEEDRVRFAQEFSRDILLEKFVKGIYTINLEVRYTLDNNQVIWMKVYFDMVENPFTHEIEAVTYAFNIDAEKKMAMIINELTGTDFDFIALLNLQNETVSEYGERSNSFYEKAPLSNIDYTESMTVAVHSLIREDCVTEALKAHSIAAITTHLEQVPIYRFSFPTKDQHIKSWRISYLDGNKLLVLIARSDITDAVQKELDQMKQVDQARMRAEQANEAKSAFLSNISHDIRTPLNGVIGFTRLAIEETDTEKRLDYLNKIKTSGELLLSLVNDTLDISRIESGKIELKLEETDSQEIGSHVINALMPSAEMKNVKLIANISAYPQKTIWADKLKIQKIILNLVSNAIKYTPSGGTVWVTIQELVPPQQDRNRRIIVKDTGIGMDESFLPILFEPFSQEHRPEMANVSGTGLGMAIVKKYVDLLEGTITVHSQLHKGTECIVDLPIARVEEGRRVQQHLDEAKVSLEGKHILLCEDNELNAEIAKMLLVSKKIIVTTAHNGQEGVDLFSQSQPGTFDGILMDIRMPMLNGFEATQAIRKLERPDAKTIPIIAMTADAFEEDMRRAQEAGMAGYITKPIEPDKLFRILVARLGPVCSDT